MKKKLVKKSLNKTQSKKCKSWIWIFVAFVFGVMVGYTTHYLVVNWHGFFVTCSDGTRPDKNGCCTGEVYTDAGDGWMVCCPNGGNNCFPPMK